MFCSAKTSRKRATARAPLGQLPDLSTTMASVPTGPCAVVHAPNPRAKVQTAMYLKTFITKFRCGLASSSLHCECR